jgi:hypothetical protein
VESGRCFDIVDARYKHEEKKIICKKCAVFGVTPVGSCCTHRAINYFLTENHLHRRIEGINILFYIMIHGSVTTTLCSGKFSQIMPFV